MITGKAGNGIRYAVRSYGNAVGYCALSTKVGTRDEEGFHNGIAHFTEHTLFKGTSRKNSSQINNTLERLGGELNAFTTKEEIVLHSTVLKKDIEKAAGLLLEIAFDARFPEEEVEIEKGVVLDEIAQCRDFPADQIYDDFEAALFGGHPLGGLILGSEESVKEITADELRAFRRKFFVPERMVLTMVSPLPEEKMVKIIEKLCGAYPSEGIIPERSSIPYTKPADVFDTCIEKENNQVNCIIGGVAPALDSEEERLATILLCNMLGGPASNSILGSNLREKHGWVYNVECNYSPYSDSGVAAIAFGCDRENLGKCVRAIGREIARLQTKTLSDKALAAAKRQMLGQNAIGMESGEAQCISMGKSLMSFGSVATDEEVVRKVESIKAETVREMACRIFDKKSTCKLVYL